MNANNQYEQIKLDLVKAIENKLKISFMYNAKRREVYPHCLGIGTKGKLQLRCYQVDAGSTPSWRLFDVYFIQDLIFSDETFIEPMPGYQRGDKAMSRIIAEV